MKMDFILSNTEQSAMEVALSSLAKKAGENAFCEYICLVPETKTLLAERMLLDASKNGAFSNIYVYSFNRLLKKIQTKKVLPLSPNAGVMIVRSIIMKNENNLVCYKKTARAAGFAENLYNTISQLKSSGINPLELLEASEKVPAALRIKLKDISLIYSEYEEYIKGQYFDPNDKLEMLEKESENSEFIKNSNIYVVGFDSLTSAMQSVIKCFVKNAKSVTVSASFMHPELKNAHISDNEAFNAFKKIADDLNIKYNPTFIGSKLAPDFEHIKNNLYAYPTVSVKSQGGLSIAKTRSVLEECKLVSSMIKKSVLSGERRYSDIYVYLASPEIQESVIGMMKDYGIPCFASLPYQFENHQLFTFLKSLFTLIKRNLESEEILRFARNSLLGLEPRKVDDFENYILKYGTNYNRFLKEFEYGKSNLSAYENAESVRQEIVEILKAFETCLENAKSVHEIVSGLYLFFEKIEMVKRLERLEALEEELLEPREAAATKQSFAKVTEVLDMLSQFLYGEQMGLDEFYNLLISGLESNDITLLPLALDEVQIITTADAIYKAKDIYIMGAIDGNFPKREADLGLISDSEITALEGINEKKIEPTIRTINRRLRFKTFELLQLASERLFISYPMRSLNGEESSPSSLVTSLCNMFLDQNGEVFLPLTDFKQIGGEASLEELVKSLGSIKNAVNFLAQQLTLYKNGGDYAVSTYIIGCLYKALEPYLNEEVKKLFENINQSGEFETLKNAGELYFKGGKTSISELETYFTCPFKHFANYGLRLKERELSSMKALDVGDILHQVAERFVNMASKNKNVIVDKAAKNILKSVLSNEKYSKDDNKILIDILEGEVVRLCTALFDEMNHSGFKTTDTEQWFGEHGKYEGIQICDNPKIEIVGKIDRIDRFTGEDGNYYRILDYKTGKIDASAKDIYYGKKLQLAIYLDAIKSENERAAGVLYFPIHNEYAKEEKKAEDIYKCKGFLLDDPNVLLKMDTRLSFDSPKSRYIFPELKTNKKNLETGVMEFKTSDGLLSSKDIESVSSYAKAAAKKAAGEIISGYVKPSPFKENGSLACSYCEYRGVCGILKNEDNWARETDAKNAKDFYKGDTPWVK